MASFLAPGERHGYFVARLVGVSRAALAKEARDFLQNLQVGMLDAVIGGLIILSVAKDPARFSMMILEKAFNHERHQNKSICCIGEVIHPLGDGVRILIIGTPSKQAVA